MAAFPVSAEEKKKGGSEKLRSTLVGFARITVVIGFKSLKVSVALPGTSTGSVRFSASPPKLPGIQQRYSSVAFARTVINGPAMSET